MKTKIIDFGNNYLTFDEMKKRLMDNLKKYLPDAKKVVKIYENRSWGKSRIIVDYEERRKKS